MWKAETGQIRTCVCIQHDGTACKANIFIRLNANMGDLTGIYSLLAGYFKINGSIAVDRFKNVLQILTPLATLLC